MADTVKVYFRGVMLFWHDEAAGVIKAILPLADPAAMSPFLHRDGTSANEHWAWLALRKPVPGREDSVTPFRQLLGNDVSFRDPRAASTPMRGHPAAYGPRLPSLIQITDFVTTDSASPLAVRPKAFKISDPGVAAIVTLAGGAMLDCSVESLIPNWRCHNGLKPGSNASYQSPAIEIMWDTGLPAVRVLFNPAMPSDTLEISASDGNLMIGNICDRLGKEWKLAEEKCFNERITDQDFKLLYQLLEPADSKRSWGDLLEGRSLPAPTVKCPPGRTVSDVSTCYSTGWGVPPQ